MVCCRTAYDLNLLAPERLMISSYKYFLKRSICNRLPCNTVILLLTKYSTLTCKFVYCFHNCEYYPLPNNVKQTNMFVVLFMFPLFVCMLLVVHVENYLYLYTIHVYQSYEKKEISVCCKLFRCLSDCIT